MEPTRKVFQTVQETIADTLRESIINGEYKPGDRLVQDDIADRYGVSRIPVREAMRTLSAEGMLTFFSRRGAIVTALSKDDIKEILSIRGVLEGMAACLAVERATAEEVERIREAFGELEASQDDPELYFQGNWAFHQAILEAAHSPRLREIINNLRNTVEPVARRYLIATGRVEIAHKDHQALVNAIESRDSKAAEVVATGHTQHVLAGILQDYMTPSSKLTQERGESRSSAGTSQPKPSQAST